jgi:hypothetical protein
VYALPANAIRFDQMSNQIFWRQTGHFEMLEAEDGIAFFVLKFQEQVNLKTPAVERTILLNVKVNRIESGISVRKRRKDKIKKAALLKSPSQSKNRQTTLLLSVVLPVRALTAVKRTSDLQNRSLPSW